MAGGAQNDDDEPITSINIIPLVDIVLVVLIIFMVTASYLVTPAIQVELPKARTGEPKVNTILSLVITKEGDLYLNNKQIDLNMLRAYIREHKAERDLEAVIAADAVVPHGRVVELIDTIKEEGVVKFAINTEHEFSSGETQ
jgi:biopolymer transport protein TolR